MEDCGSRSRRRRRKRLRQNLLLRRNSSTKPMKFCANSLLPLADEHIFPSPRRTSAPYIRKSRSWYVTNTVSPSFHPLATAPCTPSKFASPHLRMFRSIVSITGTPTSRLPLNNLENRIRERTCKRIAIRLNTASAFQMEFLTRSKQLF
jgi:hypothetical protein